MAAHRTARRKKKEQSEFFFDYSLLFVVLFLLGFGLVMIYSASSYTAFDSFGDTAYFLKKQLVAIIVGLVLMIIVANIPYHFWEHFYLLGYIVSALMIPLVLTPLGIASHGARRWIGIPNTSFNLQPAEVAKVGMILFLAVLVCKMGKSIRTMKGFAVMVAFPLPIVLEVYLITTNLSSAIIILGISVLMVFVASPDYKKFVIMALAVVAVAGLAVYLVASGSDLFAFRGSRIRAWLDPESDPLDKGFQTLQGLYAIGSGGIWGKGLGQSMQKLNFLPESHYLRGAGTLRRHSHHTDVCNAIVADDGDCKQCSGPVRRHAGSGSDGTYRDSGHIEHRGCDQHHTKYRNLASLYQLRRLLGHVLADRNRFCLKRGQENPAEGDLTGRERRGFTAISCGTRYG